MKNVARTLVLTVVSLALWSQPARAAGTYTQTKYPIVLAHGLAGYDSLIGLVDYFYGIAPDLRSGGATVYLASVPAFNSSEARGEVLLQQVEMIAALSGAGKVNLIGHSQGGLDVRYVAAVRPDLVASVTTVGTPHKGAELADILRANIQDGTVTESVAAYFAENLGLVLGLLTGHRHPQNAIGALAELTTAGGVAFTSKYPAGVPTSACGTGAATGPQGMRYYSWSGTSPVTSLVDPTDAALLLSSLLYTEAQNDGLVGRCSSHFGTVLRDNYDMNHLDEVNQVAGLRALFTDPKAIYREHANRLKIAGL
ncbi:MAG: triacylglycerol lipase [Myxococcaceae bacterium]|nr:MAG: triacylglycerol lipase [Myxococcaceae bacterium]